MAYAPIALFVYNRPMHTRHTVTALQKSKIADKSDLFVFSDAPKRPEAESAVKQVRDYIGTIGGFKSVTILEQEENKGLARSISDGVTQLCEQRDRVIVLEDDLATSPYFLDYMNDGLHRYENEDRVMQIAGYMFPVKLRISEDALFLPFISSWGWATWGRAWRHFNRREDVFEQILGDAKTKKKFDLNGRYKYSRILRAQQRNAVDSWAIFWYVSVFLRNGLSLFPSKTLVRNLGFDGTGVNCAVSKFDQDELDLGYRVSNMPKLIDVCADADQVMNNIPATRLSFTSVFNKLTAAARRRT
jgi:hypothetical protein